MNWLKNPYVIGLLVFIAFLVIVNVGSAIAAYILSGKNKKRKAIPTTPTKSSRWFWKLVIVGVIGIGVIGVVRHKAQQTTKTAPQTAPIPRLPTERKWLYGFTRPPWIKGKNLSPETRSDNYSATPLLCDSQGVIREFKIYLPKRGTYTYYYGHEVTEKPRGIQGVFTNADGLNYGVWFLKPDQQGLNPLSYGGSEVDKNGEQMEIWLRAID